MDRNPLIINLLQEDLEIISELSKIQTRKFGHDSGYFTLGRKDSSHEIGFIGEVGLLRFFKQEYGLREPGEIGLYPLGEKYDVYIIIKGRKNSIHVKTGRWKSWPQDAWAFGVHADQKIEDSSSPLVLVSYLSTNNATIQIEGFMTSVELKSCPIIKKGETFPGMSYPSRCDNKLTYFRQYKSIKGLINYLKNC